MQDIDQHPDSHHHDEANNKGPRTTEARNRIRHTLTEGIAGCQAVFNVKGTLAFGHDSCYLLFNRIIFIIGTINNLT